jgi:hypothetical protein
MKNRHDFNDAYRRDFLLFAGTTRIGCAFPLVRVKDRNHGAL